MMLGLPSEKRLAGLRGLGDWFAPDCTPGSAGCVPHWYCYLPLMATPDCLASFESGVEEGASDIVAPVAGTVSAAVGGAASGAAAGLSSGLLTGGTTGTVLIVGGVLIVAALLAFDMFSKS
jgi:hypothetical protein